MSISSAFDDFLEYFVKQMMKSDKESHRVIAALEAAINMLNEYLEGLKSKIGTEDEETLRSAHIDGKAKDQQGEIIESGQLPVEKKATVFDKPETFRGKKLSYLQSYIILSYMLRNTSKSIGLQSIVNAVEAVFGTSNQGSLNTKLNRWKDEGVLYWSHPDKRKVTKEGEQERLRFAELIDPAERKRIDDILETL